MRLYFFPTLNAHKVTIALEEMGLACELAVVNILEGDQARPEFLAVNPNGRIPALVDGDAPGGPVTVFESAAILQYLARKTGRFYPAEEAIRARIDSWLFWQMAGLGPMSGQVNYFTRLSQKADRDPADWTYALGRYRRETERLFGVLERGLDEGAYLCGAYSIADMCVWPWIDKYPANGGGLDRYPAIAAWHARIAARPAVQRALAVGADQVKLSSETRARWTQKG